MDKYQIYKILQDNPDWITTLKEALQIEPKKQKKAEKMGFEKMLGWEWYEVHTPAPTLNKMVTQGLLDIPSKSRNSTHFILKNPVTIQEAINIFESGTIDQQPKQENQIPNDLFNVIVSHDKIKQVLNKSIKSPKPTHALLYGPPATAKSLFLSELSRLPDSKQILGSTVSKAGLVEYLLEFKPKYLIFDEIDKAHGTDLSTMLSLMETGLVTRLKKGMRETETLKTWVFASANKINKLPEELKSRFLKFEIKPYSIEELQAIAHKILDMDTELINYIVKKVTTYSKDIRDIQKVGNLVKNKEDVDIIIDLLW